MFYKNFTTIAAISLAAPCFAQSPSDIDLYVDGMPIPMIEGPFFTSG